METFRFGWKKMRVKNGSVTKGQRERREEGKGCTKKSRKKVTGWGKTDLDNRRNSENCGLSGMVGGTQEP